MQTPDYPVIFFSWGIQAIEIVGDHTYYKVIFKTTYNGRRNTG